MIFLNGCIVISFLTVFGFGPHFKDPEVEIPKLDPISRLSVFAWGLFSVVGVVWMVGSILWYLFVTNYFFLGLLFTVFLRLFLRFFFLYFFTSKIRFLFKFKSSSYGASFNIDRSSSHSY